MQLQCSAQSSGDTRLLENDLFECRLSHAPAIEMAPRVPKRLEKLHQRVSTPFCKTSPPPLLKSPGDGRWRCCQDPQNP